MDELIAVIDKIEYKAESNRTNRNKLFNVNPEIREKNRLKNKKYRELKKSDKFHISENRKTELSKLARGEN